jgi:hypothetical protein
VAVDNQTSYEPTLSHQQNTQTGDETRLNLAYKGEEQVLPKVASRTEDDEGNCGDQVQQGALDK